QGERQIRRLRRQTATQTRGGLQCAVDEARMEDELIELAFQMVGDFQCRQSGGAIDVKLLDRSERRTVMQAVVVELVVDRRPIDARRTLRFERLDRQAIRRLGSAVAE